MTASPWEAPRAATGGRRRSLLAALAAFGLLGAVASAPVAGLVASLSWSLASVCAPIEAPPASSALPTFLAVWGVCVFATEVAVVLTWRPAVLARSDPGTVGAGVPVVAATLLALGAGALMGAATLSLAAAMMTAGLLGVLATIPMVVLMPVSGWVGRWLGAGVDGTS